MPLIRRCAYIAGVPLLSLAIALTGCRVETHDHGDRRDVSVGTPFGSMAVHTDGSGNVANLGLTPYPGATLVHKKEDDGAADINMSFGSFKMGLRAEELQTTDAGSKVLAFYRKDMSRYGTVIACRDDQPVGDPTRTADGLTCTSDTHNNGNHDGELELRAGSPLHQHIVGVSEADGGTRIGLVALDLPNGSGHDARQQE